MDYVTGWVLCHHVMKERFGLQKPAGDFISEYEPSRLTLGVKWLLRLIRRYRTPPMQHRTLP